MCQAGPTQGGLQLPKPGSTHLNDLHSAEEHRYKIYPTIVPRLLHTYTKFHDKHSILNVYVRQGIDTDFLVRMNAIITPHPRISADRRSIFRSRKISQVYIKPAPVNKSQTTRPRVNALFSDPGWRTKMLISATPARLQHMMRTPSALLCPSKARARTAKPAEIFLPAAAGHMKSMSFFASGMPK